LRFREAHAVTVNARRQRATATSQKDETMTCSAGSRRNVVLWGVALGAVLTTSSAAFAQAPAAPPQPVPTQSPVQAGPSAEQAEPELAPVPEPPSAVSPQRIGLEEAAPQQVTRGPVADPPGAQNAKPEDDDDDDDDDRGNGNGNQATDSKRDDVTGVSPQSSGFDGDAWGDDSSQMAAGPLTFRLALQTRYRETFTEPSGNMRTGIPLREDVLAQEADGFALQRFLLRMAVTPKPWLSFKGTLDFAKLRGSDVSNVLKQAFATLRPVPERVELNVGVFKIPYSILELDPVSQYELTDFGDSNELINDLGFAGRDVGVSVLFAPLPKPKWARLVVSAFRGHAKDEHSSPLGVLAARIESKPWVKGLRFGASVVGMPFSQSYKQPFETSSKDVLPNPPDQAYPREQRWDNGKAYGADISYTRKRFTVRVEGLLGDRVDVDQRYGARSYSAIWGLVAYRFKIGKIGLMPAARVEFMDADTEHDTGGRRILSLGLNVLYKRTVRFVFDVSRTDVQGNTPVIEQPTPLPYYPYMALDNTRVTAQLQLEL
jgi:hypothetical protein